MTSSPRRRCAAPGCPRTPTFGSRCARHWLRRQRAYLALPTKTEWWRAVEPVLIAGIELRAMTIWDGVTPGAVRGIIADKKAERWQPFIDEIINAADRAARRYSEEHRGGSAEAR